MDHPLTVLDLFSGIGGFSYAAERLVGGFQTVAFCETDGACQRVLAKHWPNTPIFSDVCSLTAADVKSLCPNGLSLITAGFPCQDLSIAGKQAGYDGKRSVLFYEIIRLARELQPRFILLENVRNLLSHKNGETFQETLFQIAKAGYDAEWAVIPASDVGACHRRERIWIIAYATNVLSNGGTIEYAGEFTRRPQSQLGDGDRENATYSNYKGLEGRKPASMSQHPFKWTIRKRDTPSATLSHEWTSYVSQPVLRRGDDGLSNRVDRLKQLGNSIVPQVAAIPLTRIKALAQQNSVQ